MTRNSPQAAAPYILDAARFVRQFRDAPALRWIGHASTYSGGVLIATALSLGTAFFVPWFLGPAAFGTYTLLTSLFIYANKNDLGLSQLADRKLAVEQGAHPDCASAILRARMIIGAIMLGMIVPLAMGITYITDTLPAADTGLAIAAGAAFMMANGPVTVNPGALADLNGPTPEIVLNNLSVPLSGGETVQIVLNFANAGAVSLNVPVEPAAYEYATFAPPAPTP